MYFQTDFKQIVGIVKERNRFYKSLNKVRKIALSINSENISDDVRGQLILIIQECDDALEPKNYSQEFEAIAKRINLK